MNKMNIGNNVFIPMPVVLVGANVEGKANFMAVGWITRVNAQPPMMAIGINKSHYTPLGIQENKTFSINFPSIDMVEKTDYCGLVSGRKTDKSKIFKVFYGETKTAPMIEECPLCMECKVMGTVDLPSNNLFIGEIIRVYADEWCLTDGKPDFKKINPLLFTMPDNSYWAIGEFVAKAWYVGKKLE
ncbi:MAG: flavin reductase family protein [Nitrospirota bacterium]|nr:flavin reductase family protein [Nitrospirota bacterium]MDH5767582.1 flavin reductase family protein [Nitrospirota bacterium]